LPAELFATIGVFSGALITYELTGNTILAAYIGTIGDNLGYYTYITFHEIKVDKKEQKVNNKKYGMSGFLKTSRSLLIEFGPGEALDSFIVRPAALILFPILLGNYVIGLIIGVLIADIIFYIPTIMSYELKKKHMKK
jgi:hypothetical protein